MQCARDDRAHHSAYRLQSIRHVRLSLAGLGEHFEEVVYGRSQSNRRGENAERSKPAIKVPQARAAERHHAALSAMRAAS